MQNIQSICVFCGASPGFSPIYLETAQKVGNILAHHQIKLVYGGGKVGMMGAVADGVLAKNGQVTGIIPHFLDHREVIHPEVKDMIILENMHDRKAKMYELSDGFVALPGGFGTLDELFEIVTWGQLGLHKKPIGILNIEGFFDDLVRFIDNLVEKGFVKSNIRNLIVVANTFEDLLHKMQNHEAPETEDWVHKVKET